MDLTYKLTIHTNIHKLESRMRLLFYSNKYRIYYEKGQQSLTCNPIPLLDIILWDHLLSLIQHKDRVSVLDGVHACAKEEVVGLFMVCPFHDPVIVHAIAHTSNKEEDSE